MSLTSDRIPLTVHNHAVGQSESDRGDAGDTTVHALIFGMQVWYFETDVFSMFSTRVTGTI